MTPLSDYGDDRIFVQEMSASGFNPTIEAIRTCYAAIGNVDADSDDQGRGFTPSVPPPPILAMTAMPTRPTSTHVG